MSNSISLHVILAIAAAVAGVIVAVVTRLALRRRRNRKWATKWQALVADLVIYMLPWAALIAGGWVAVNTLVSAENVWRVNANHVLEVLIVLAVTLSVARAAADAVRAGALEHSGISGSATIFVNITRGLILTLGLLIALNGLGVSITPLLTALGVGGLAVALALQDSLTNLFAGVHILASRKVQAGDFIALDNGQEGYVVDTNWRNTTIRQLSNNLIIVPNATLAASVVTNYHHPEEQTSVIVQVGVSYDSDLEHVEAVTCEVGRDVMRMVDGAVRDHEPFIRYHTFADSSVNFSVILRAVEVTGKYLITHEFIKRLHRRYQQEGIEIPFPIRTVVMSGQPDLAVQANGGSPPGGGQPASSLTTLSANRSMPLRS